MPKLGLAAGEYSEELAFQSQDAPDHGHRFCAGTGNCSGAGRTPGVFCDGQTQQDLPLER